MSRSTMYAFTNDGKLGVLHEYHNSWRWAAYVWKELFDKYVKDPEIPYDNWLAEGRSKDLWKLVDDERLADFEVKVLWLTFDYSVVRIVDIPRVVAALRQFHCNYPDESHLPAMILDLEQLSSDPGDYQAVCWQATSVSENVWRPYYSETDEHRTYDLDNGKKHEFFGDAFPLDAEEE